MLVPRVRDFEIFIRAYGELGADLANIGSDLLRANWGSMMKYAREVLQKADAISTNHDEEKTWRSSLLLLLLDFLKTSIINAVTLWFFELLVPAQDLWEMFPERLDVDANANGASYFRFRNSASTTISDASSKSWRELTFGTTKKATSDKIAAILSKTEVNSQEALEQAASIVQLLGEQFDFLPLPEGTVHDLSKQLRNVMLGWLQPETSLADDSNPKPKTEM